MEYFVIGEVMITQVGVDCVELIIKESYCQSMKVIILFLFHSH